MSALGKAGRPTRSERRQSDELSDRLLAEYLIGDVTYEELAGKHGMKKTAAWFRCQRARERKRQQ